MNIILFDDSRRANLYPLSLTRPVSHLRLGIGTLAEKWEAISGSRVSFLVPEYLSIKYPARVTEDNLLINSRYLPGSDLWKAIQALATGQTLRNDLDCIAARSGAGEVINFAFERWEATFRRAAAEDMVLLYPEDLVKHNRELIERDFDRLSRGRKSQKLNESNRVLGNSLFVEEGVNCEFATLNTLTGPIYLGKNAQIMEGCHIRGPFAMLDNSVLKMGSKIYGATTLGPWSTLGGETKNSIITGFSNKTHEGYLGDSVLGEWCNLGADTNNSNMKNNYRNVSLYDYTSQTRRETKLQFLGMIMGDHSKSGINATFNTGTVVGAGVNFFGTALSPSFLPDFTWSEDGKLSEHRLDKMLETAGRVLGRRDRRLEDEDRQILESVYRMTAQQRNYIK